MRIKLQGVTVSYDALDIDVDPEDFSHEMLMQCVSLAAERGLLKTPEAQLYRTIERAYASLVRGDLALAMAQLGCSITPTDAVRHIKTAVWEKRLTQETKPQPQTQTNGFAPALRRPS